MLNGTARGNISGQPSSEPGVHQPSLSICLIRLSSSDPTLREATYYSLFGARASWDSGPTKRGAARLTAALGLPGLWGAGRVEAEEARARPGSFNGGDSKSVCLGGLPRVSRNLGFEERV